jgi:glycosyltransferase involved in cell wall biosynthesis
MASEDISTNKEKINIVSVGRLNYQKGFDIAIEACKQLKKDGYDFVWNILGEGEERGKLEKMIKEYHLEDMFILGGIKENPYPYIKQADIYVQPSRFEGKSIAIDEAKILNKPILVTNFSTAKDQINDQINGLIVDMNPECIYNGIKQLIDSDELRRKLSQNLSNEELGTEKEIEKLYKMFD